MADTTQAFTAATSGFALQDAEFSEARERNMRIVRAQYASGDSDINADFSLDRRFRLVYVRGTFTGPTIPDQPNVPLAITLRSNVGTAFNCRLFTMTHAAPDSHVNFRLTQEELSEPSAWTFQPGDAINITWTNPLPNQISWAVEVGLARAT
ncbi:MAG: hypothetical protein ACPGXK_17110 [Phycisphaerae bacterium]